MGSMQGDDLQLQGDMACQNAEVRGVLKVGGKVVGPSTPQPPFPSTGAIFVDEIFVRTTGSDTSGDGSSVKPYASALRAVRDVPSVPPSGVRYVVDSDVFEPLPPGYALPVIQFPVIDYATDNSTPYYYSGAGLIFRSTPKLATSIPAADAVITAGAGAMVSIVPAAPGTNLVLLTVPVARPSWTTANLKDKHVIRTVTQSFGSTIVEATTTTLLIADSVGDFNGGVGALSLAPGEELHIVQPSAGFIGGADVPIDSFGDTFAAFTSTCNSIGFQGWSFTQPGSGFPVSVGFLNCPQVTMEICDLQGLFVQGDAGTYYAYLTGCAVTGAAVLAVNSSVFINKSHYHDVELWYPANCTPQAFTDSVIDDSATLSNSAIRGVTIFMSLALRNVWIRNAIIGFSESPTGDGVYLKEGNLSIQSTQIDGSQGNGVRVDRMCNASITSLAGTGNGAGGAGVGVKADEGAGVRLFDTATTITGIDGDLQAGALIVRAWGTAPAVPPGNFYFDAPAGQEYDLAGVNAGASAATCTGTRIYLKP